MRAIHVAAIIGAMVVAGSAPAQEQMSIAMRAEFEAVAGVYSLVRVNERPLPTGTWTRRSPEVICNTEMRDGMLLLDTKGRWAWNTTERDRCEFADLKRSVFPDVSTVASGSYTITGSRVELRDDASGATYAGELAGGRITFAVAGSGSLDGQHMTYTMRRVRQVR